MSHERPEDVWRREWPHVIGAFLRRRPAALADCEDAVQQATLADHPSMARHHRVHAVRETYRWRARSLPIRYSAAPVARAASSTAAATLLVTSGWKTLGTM